jgi:hypothetical protein
MNNAVLNEWVPMEADVVIPDEVQFINVDTRDFHWFMSTEPVGVKAPNLPICWSTTNPEQLFFLINELRIRCSDKKWNFLTLNNPQHEWLKYIWFKREKDGNFSVWTRNWGTTLNTTHGLAVLINWNDNA